MTKKHTDLFLIDEQGGPLGVMLYRDAMQIAKDKGLELFIINAAVTPIIGRLMDYGRFKFEQEKQSRVVARKYTVSSGKELKMHYEITDHDFQIKLRSAQRFLQSGEKIRVSVILRGREVRHSDLALDLLSRFAANLGDLAQFSDQPKLEGKNCFNDIAASSPQSLLSSSALLLPDPTRFDNLKFDSESSVHDSLQRRNVDDTTSLN